MFLLLWRFLPTPLALKQDLLEFLVNVINIAKKDAQLKLSLMN